MKRTSAWQVVLAGCVLLVFCTWAAAQEVKYNFVQGTDFSKYRSYKWVRVPNTQYPNQILDNQIMQAIDAQLALKGLSKTESDTPDLYVCYQASVSQQQQWNSYSSGGGGWGYGRWGGWGGMQTTTTTSSTINIGTINLDIYDVIAKNQIWRGSATKTLGSGETQALWLDVRRLGKLCPNLKSAQQSARMVWLLNGFRSRRDRMFIAPATLKESSLRRSEMSQFLRHRWRSCGAQSVEQTKAVNIWPLCGEGSDYYREL